MEQETHEARCNDWVVNPDVPSSPHLLKPTEFREINVCIELLSSSLSHSGDGRRVESHDGRSKRDRHLNSTTPRGFEGKQVKVKIAFRRTTPLLSNNLWREPSDNNSTNHNRLT